MSVRHHEQLEAWQLCDGLRRRRLGLLSGPQWNRHWGLKDQIWSAINSACSNTSEGFWRYAHREFSHFANVARASVGELSSHLREARDIGLITAAELGVSGILCVRRF